MRTVIAPFDREVEAQIEALDDQLARIARGYIERLRLEPYLGTLVPSGYLAAAEVRRVLFDRESRPEQLFAEHRGRLRVAEEDPSQGPSWRVVYELLEAPRTGVRVVRVLGVGRGHEDPGEIDVYRAAEATLRRLRGETR